MRKNEYESLEQFTSQYVGEWNPSGGHWFGLDFMYRGKEYRFVRAKGTVVIEGKKEYNKYLSKTYQKHGLEKHKKNVYCLRYQQNRFFLHNPLIVWKVIGNML